MRSKPSATAMLIAESMVLLGLERETADLVSPGALEWSQRFLESARSERWVARMRRPFARRLAEFRERWSVPGIRLHYLVRKQFLEDCVRQAIGEGLRQVVVLAAGFDTLAVRLSQEFPAVHFFELDHPATQQPKLEALQRAEISRANLELRPLDLTRQGLRDSLLSIPSFQPALQTLFICEGISMYLTAREIDTLLGQIRSFSGARVLLTILERQRDGTVRFEKWNPVASLWLSVKGEPFRWGMRMDEIGQFLLARGFDLLKTSSPLLFRSRYLGEARGQRMPLALGEYVAVAQLRES